MGRVLAVIIWIITLLSVLLFISGKWWFPAAISEHAPALDRQFMITIVVVGLAFTAAQIGLGWMVWKYRDTGKPGDRALYAEVGRVYAPFLLANADALARGAGRVECTIDGRPFVQKPFPYQGKCLAWLREAHAALAAGDRAALDAFLAGTGCETLFA